MKLPLEIPAGIDEVRRLSEKERLVTTSRVQESVERLLSQAADASARLDWSATRDFASAALSFDPDNSQASWYLSAARKNLAVGADQRLLLSPGRVLLLALLSGGLYLFYWSYLTWKQLKSETRDDHYPV